MACTWLANRHTRDDVPTGSKGASKYEELKHIDYAGIACLSVAIATLVLAINGGVGPAWRVVFAVVCAAFSVLFVWLELSWARKPLIPLTMVQDVGMFWLAQLFTFGGREGVCLPLHCLTLLRWTRVSSRLSANGVATVTS